jgi:hypothetical protein
MGISGIPADALPYITGSYLMDTSRLRVFLGDDYRQVIRFSIVDALADSFAVTENNKLSESADRPVAEAVEP